MVGGLFAQTSVSADAAGYRRLFDFARAQVPGRRCWAVEGAGSYGAGLDGVPGGPRRAGGGGRPAQAAPAAQRRQDRRAGCRPRGGGGARSRLSAGPRRRGDREALRVLLATRHSACAAKVSATNQLKALIVARRRSCGPSWSGWWPRSCRGRWSYRGGPDQRRPGSRLRGPAPWRCRAAGRLRSTCRSAAPQPAPPPLPAWAPVAYAPAAPGTSVLGAWPRGAHDTAGATTLLGWYSHHLP
jgi:hypothetical protein